MRIGELSRRTGVSVRALRYYEEEKLLVPARSPNGYRDYDDDAVRRVEQIQVLFSAGLCSAKVGELLPCVRSDGGRVVAGSGLVDELEWEYDRISRQIEGMRSSLRILGDVIATAKAGE